MTLTGATDMASDSAVVHRLNTALVDRYRIALEIGASGKGLP